MTCTLGYWYKTVNLVIFTNFFLRLQAILHDASITVYDILEVDRRYFHALKYSFVCMKKIHFCITLQDSYFVYATNYFPEDLKCVLKMLLYESNFPEHIMKNYKKCNYCYLSNLFYDDCSENV